MRTALILIAAASLLGTIAPSVAYLLGMMTLPQTQLVTLLATLGWFVHAPLATRRSAGE